MNENGVLRQILRVDQLVHLHECSQMATYAGLGLRTNHPEKKRNDFMRNLCRSFGLYLRETKEETKKEIRKVFEREYLPDFFALPIQWELGKTADLQMFGRAVDYLFDNDYIFRDTASFEVPVEKCYGDVMVEAARGTCLLFERNGGLAAVQLVNSAPAYSKAARKMENKIFYSLELLSMVLGLKERYPELTEATLIYLRMDGEKAPALKEELADKNICTLTIPMEEAKLCWEERLSLEGKCDCGKCSYADLCRIPEYQEGEAVDAPISKAGEPADDEAMEKAEEKPKERLTDAQKEIVEHRNGPLCCIAVPGAGKTHSLVRRLESMAKEGIDTGSILFITFTRKAADEIKTRTMSLLEGKKEPLIVTFHAFAMQIIRECQDVKYQSLRLAESMDRKSLIEKALAESERIDGASYQGLYGKFGLLATLDNAFRFYEENGEDELRRKYMFLDVDALLKVYERYHSLYQSEGYISYDEMVPMAVEILESHPDMLMRYRKKYSYVMADEFQDVSSDQCRLLYLIADHRNIVVVGDDDQTIYSWRGGTNRYMLEFLEDWPDGKLVYMEDNFRSADKILEAAGYMIGRNARRIAKQIIPHHEGAVPPVYLKNVMARNIPFLVRAAMKNGYQPGDIAVIARQNKDLEAVARELTPEIKVMRPKVPLLEDAVFSVLRDVLSLYYSGMDDDKALFRILKRFGCTFTSIPTEKGTFYERLVASGFLLPIDCFDVELIDRYEERKEESPFMKAGCQLAKCFKELMYTSSITWAFRRVFELIFEKEGSEITPEAVTVLERKAEERLIGSVKEMFDHMELMALYQDETEVEYPERPDSVNLLTAHKSKGKEYPMVIVYGVEAFGDSEEDRCVLYVAMTRAKKTLYMTEAPHQRSVLLEDMDRYVLLKGG